MRLPVSYMVVEVGRVPGGNPLGAKVLHHAITEGEARRVARDLVDLDPVIVFKRDPNDRDCIISTYKPKK